jgi:hypothetical protein
MPGKQFNEVQIHLADHGSNPAVLQGVDVPARSRYWLLASRNSCFGRQAAVLREDAVNCIPIEPTFLGNEKKVGARIPWPLVQPDAEG